MRLPFCCLLAGAIVTSLMVSGIALLGAPSALAASFTPGDLVVIRVGTGSSALGSSATAVFLDEYTHPGIGWSIITDHLGVHEGHPHLDRRVQPR